MDKIRSAAINIAHYSCNAFKLPFSLVFCIFRVLFMNKKFYRTCAIWREFGKELLDIVPRVFLPKFIFISIATLTISTSGIWIGPVFLNDESQIGFSIFSFVIATLGVLAAENLLNIECEGLPPELRQVKQAKTSLMVALWFIAIVCSFYGVKNKSNIDFGLWVSLIITLLLWVTITAHKPDFNVPATPDNVITNDLVKMENESMSEPGVGLL